MVFTDPNGRVTGLSLGGNGLRGKLPPELGNLTLLGELWLGDGNNITGVIPHELSAFGSLKVLDLGLNDMSGAIPPWLGDMRELRQLYLDGNRFSGAVPAELGRLTKLELLPLHGNAGLLGALPEALTEIEGLQWLTFDDTGLCAPLEEGFQAWILNILDRQGPDCPPESPISRPTNTPIPESTAAPAPTVLSLEVSEITPLRFIGEMAQLSVAANMSDGSSQAVGSELVEWVSSDPEVVAVSEGEVTAVGPGNATVAAIYEGASAEAPISVRIPARETGAVRVLYAAPLDREFRPDYSEGLLHGYSPAAINALDVQRSGIRFGDREDYDTPKQLFSSYPLSSEETLDADESE